MLHPHETEQNRTARGQTAGLPFPMPPVNTLDYEPRYVDADYLTLSPADFDALIARYKAINAAATNFARLLDERGGASTQEI